MATTADQIVVEIRASVDQHIAATKQVADATTRDMAKVEGAVTQAEEATAKAADSGAAAVEKGSDRKQQAIAATVAAEQVAAAQSDAVAARLLAASERTVVAQGRAAEAAKAAAGAVADAAQKRATAEQAGTAAALKAAVSAEAVASRKIASAQKAASAAKIAAADEALAFAKAAAATEAAAARQVSATQRAAAAGREAAGGSFSGGNRGTLGGAGGLSNVSYQLQDFIVQVSSGTGALRAFSQQAPQLLSGFGPWGAVLGIAAAGVGVLATALGGFESAADKAQSAQKAFDAAMTASKGLFSEQEQEAIKLVSSLSLVEKGYLGIARQRIDEAIRKSTEAMAAAGDEAASAGRKIQAAIISSEPDNGGAFKQTTDQIYALAKALQDPNITPRQYNEIVIALQALREKAAAAGFDLTKVTDATAAAGEASIKLSDNQKVLGENVARVNELNTIGASLLRAFGFSASEATGHISTLTSGLGGYIAQLRQALSLSSAAPGAINGVVASLRQQNAQMGDTVKSQKDYADNQRAMAQGTAAWDEELKNTGSRVKALLAFTQAYGEQVKITRREQDASKQGKSTAEDDLANLQAQAAALNGTKANSQKVAAEQRARAASEAAYSKSLAETGDATKAAEIKSKTYAAQLAIETKNQQASAGAAKVSAAAKREAAIDKSDLKIQQQIDLNTRLIGVYTQGAAAREQAKAQYDAENEARSLNLKVGTEQYNLFVKQRTEESEKLRLSNLTLADYAKGEALTKSSMTAQEAYNASLIELNKLRAEGAITTETYDRAVLKLNADHNGYVEGINAIAQAIQGSIQGATSFSDALVKVGLQLAQLLIQAAAFGGNGGGPLGKLFDSLAGVSGGLIGNLIKPSAISQVGGAADFATSLVGIGRAGGGQALPGNIYQVGETGREWFAPSVPGQVIPNSVIKNAAGGGGGSNQPINIIIPLAGANGDRAIAEITAAGVKKGLQSVPEINRQHAIRFA